MAEYHFGKDMPARLASAGAATGAPGSTHFQPKREQSVGRISPPARGDSCRSRINTSDSIVPKNTSGDAFGVPPIVLPVTLTAYFFFAAFLAAFFAGFFATAFLVAIFSILPLSSRHRTCKRYFAVNECIES